MSEYLCIHVRMCVHVNFIIQMLIARYLRHPHKYHKQHQGLHATPNHAANDTKYAVAQSHKPANMQHI